MNQTELLSAPRAEQPLPSRETNDRQRILVVDDDAAMRRLNTEVLLCYGYAVDTADDGATAWEALQFQHYDLLLTDNGMPKVTGIELLKMVQESGRDLPTIMATGTSPAEEFAKTPWLRPPTVLLKPYTFDELVEAVGQVLQEAAGPRRGIAPPPNWSARPRVCALGS